MSGESSSNSVDCGPRARFVPFGGIAGKTSLDDPLDAAFDPRAVVPRFEPQRHRARQNDLRQRVGERSFEAIADFDAHFALVRRDQEKDAIVLFCFAELPRAKQAIGVGFDVQALKRVDRRDNELDARFILKISELALDRAFRGRRNDIGMVNHPTSEWRIVHRRESQRRDKKKSGASQRAASRIAICLRIGRSARRFPRRACGR